jgi:hypothetical protein
MSNINQALFRIDPTQGLLQYVNAVKPFHSKVLDVFVEYIYTESLNVSMKDSNKITVGFQSEQLPTMYSNGFGYVWNSYSLASPSQLPHATIISAVGKVEVQSSITPGSSTITPISGNMTFSVGDKVLLNTTGTLPISTPPILQGSVFYVVSASLGSITISSTLSGPPVVFSATGTGILSVLLESSKVNSFLLALPPQPIFPMVVSNLNSNQVSLVTQYSIASVIVLSKKWLIPGNLTIGTTPLVSGSLIYITDNTDPSANQKYTVTSVYFNSGTTQTEVTVQEPISLLATNTGQINIPLSADEAPYWPTGTALTVSGSSLPLPLVAGTTYYFNPTSNPGIFNFSRKRYPAVFTDVIDIKTIGAGLMTVKRDEPFVPGETFVATGTFNGINDAQYKIMTITKEGSNYRANVLQTVQQSTPTSLTSDGIVTYLGSYGDPSGVVVSGSNMLVSASFAEKITFEFGPAPVLSYLFDSFSGVGNLSNHTGDSGHSWNTFQLGDTADKLVLTGNGSVTTTDPDIWARSNWIPPISGNFYVEAELFIKSLTSPNSSYFRIFAKESNISAFHGPHLDVYVNPVTNKLAIQVWDGDAAIGNFFTLNTAISSDTSVTIRLALNNNNRVQAYVDNVLVYTSAVISLPLLTFVGFNFHVPTMDPQQFLLSRMQAHA